MRLLDTNVLVRHVSGAPPDQAAAATRLLTDAATGELVLTDVHVSEFVWVLQSSIYKAPRESIRSALEGILALSSISVSSPSLLQDAIDLYATRGMAWTDAYLVASARAARADEIVSFDQFDTKIQDLGVRRVEPTARP